MKRIGRNDIIFIAVLAAAVLFACVLLYGGRGAQGARVEVTVDGVLYGSYALSEDQEVPIVIDGVATNLLLISGGTADMTEADCPDQLCVRQRAVSRENETICCLPNRVVVRVVGGEESGFDTIAK